MRILSILAQKPGSTGSGIYLKELCGSLEKAGHEQAILAGIEKEEQFSFPFACRFYPVRYGTEALPFPVCGMSDEMPYPSTVYGKMTGEMLEQFKTAFSDELKRVVAEFRPDVILAHHLFLLTALARELFPRIPLFGFCHGTDIRQMKKWGVEKEYIGEQIRRLDGIFALQQDQKEEILRLYGADEKKIRVLGGGYNDALFRPDGPMLLPERTEVCIDGHDASTAETDAESGAAHDPETMALPYRLVYAGKLSYAKGVDSLLNALAQLPFDGDELELHLAGGYGEEAFYKQLRDKAEALPYRVIFHGPLSQQDLAALFRSCDLLVQPSFYEGLSLVLLEGMACGLRVLASNLPGVKPWMKENVPDHSILFIRPPRMLMVDEAEPEDLPDYECRLAGGISISWAMGRAKQPDLSGVSWDGICRKVEAAIR